MKKYILLILFLFSGMMLRAQGLVTIPLKDNEAQRAQFEKTRKMHHNAMQKRFVPDTVPMRLPFFDDFSYIDKWEIDTAYYHGVYPYDELWMDHNVFINATMADSPPSIGVATFDGLDSNGRAYNPFAGQGSSAPADTLTSRPIGLDSIPKKDSSLYFSFYYQPQGLGVAPKTQDTLAVEFKYIIRDSIGKPVHDIHGKDSVGWKHIWGATGRGDTAFKMVLIKVDSSFYYRNFQFRFVAYANNNGNLNHWHVDYVYLQKNRSKADTFIRDVALSNLPQSISNRYFAMPAKQFTAVRVKNGLQGELLIEMKALVENHDSAILGSNTNFKYLTLNLVNHVPLLNDSTFSNSQQIQPHGKYVFLDSVLKHGNLNLNAAPTTDDSLIYRTKFITSTVNGSNNYGQNDYAYRVQPFTNYFAYDDGTAEAGFGLINVQSGQVAINYSMNDTGTLQGVLIHFNQSEKDVSTNSFSLIVWHYIDLGGSPGNTHDQILLQMDNLIPQYVDRTNGYYYYKFDTPIKLPAGDFYVGWMQNSNFILNIGFDKNYDEISDGQPNPYIYYNVDGSWTKNSSIHGAPMIRPVVDKSPYVGIEGIKEENVSGISIYPNPSTGKINLSLPLNSTCAVSFYDLNGRLLQTFEKLSGHPELDFSGHTPGMYLLKISSEKQTWYKKVILY